MWQDRYEFFVIMQKRRDGRVYPDLHKSSEKMYLTITDAERELVLDPEMAKYRHIVRMYAILADETDKIDKTNE